jgi:mevalonate pyrophosphate decarboxylase
MILNNNPEREEIMRTARNVIPLFKKRKGENAHFVISRIS